MVALTRISAFAFSILDLLRGTIIWSTALKTSLACAHAALIRRTVRGRVTVGPKNSMLNFDNTTPPNHLANRFPRAFGMLLFIVSLGLGKWQIYNPLHAAEDQRSEV